MKRVVPIIAIALCACEPQPPHWGDVCVDEQMVMLMQPTFMPGPNGTSTMTMTPQFIPQCYKYERQCIIDDRWKKTPNVCSSDVHP